MSTKPRYPYCILATAVVPWNADGSFAEDIFRREVRLILKGLTRHVYIFGTAGEGYAVNERQYDEICRVFHDVTSAPDVYPMIGLINLSLATVIDRIERAREMGFRNFQISLPSWGALRDTEMFRFFKETCGRFPDCKFLHYNLLRTQRLLTADEYAVLAAEHLNLVATKNSTDAMSRIIGLMNQGSALTHFMTETGYAHASLIGKCGLLISMASTNFARGKAYFQAGQKREVGKLLAMQQELSQLTTKLVALGLKEAHIDGAFDKLFCKIHDPEFPLRLAPPYDSISDATFEKVVTMIRQEFPRWIK